MRQQDRRVRSGENHEAGEEALARQWPWLLPLASGIFLGAAIFEMVPEALALAGAQTWFWALAGLVLLVLVRDGLDYLGRHGMAWVATLGIWVHSFLEGAVTATSYGVSLVVGILVSVGLILHLIPEVGAVVTLLLAAGLSLRQALIRNIITWVFIVVGFMVVYFFLPNLSPAVLGAAIAAGAGGFLYLAYLSFTERQWPTLPSLFLVAIGVGLMGVIRAAT